MLVRSAFVLACLAGCAGTSTSVEDEARTAASAERPVPADGRDATAEAPIRQVDGLAAAREQLASANAALERGDLAAARSAIEAGLAESIGGERTLDRASLLEQFASAAQRAQDLPAVRRAREAAVELRTALQPEDARELLAARVNLARIVGQQGDIASSSRVLEEVHERQSRLLPSDDLDLQVTRHALGASLRMRGRFEEARDLLAKVVAVRERVLGPEHTDTLYSLAALGYTLGDLGDWAGERALHERIHGILERTLAPDDARFLAACNSLANTLTRAGEFAAARELYATVLAARERVLPPDHPDLQLSRANLAVVLDRLGDLDGARRLLEQAVEVYGRIFPPEHPLALGALNNLGVVHYGRKDYHAAFELGTTVLQRRERTLHPDHPDLRVSRTNVALAAAALGDEATARPLLEEVLADILRTLPEDHELVQEARENLAIVLTREEDWPLQRALREHVLAARERAHPADHPLVARARTNLAQTLSSMQDYSAARALHEGALEAYSRTHAEDHPLVIEARRNLATSLLYLDEHDAALAALEGVLDARERTLPAGHPDLREARASLLQALLASGVSEARTEPGAPVRAARAREVFEVFARDGVEDVLEASLACGAREAEERCAHATADMTFGFTLGLGTGPFAPTHDLVPALFEWSETARGAGLVAAAAARRGGADPASANLRAELGQASARLARIARAGTTGSEFLRARERRDAAERALAERGRANSERPGTITAASVAATLGASRAVVAYRRMSAWRLSMRDRGPDAPPAPHFENTSGMIAFVVRGGDRAGVELVDLGPAEPIEQAVRAWREGLGVADGRGRAIVGSAGAANLHALGARLRELVFDPLRDALRGADHLELLVDGALHLVPFDALPDVGEASGALLGDRLRIDVRSTLARGARAPADRSTRDVLVALGGVDYAAGFGPDGEEAPDPMIALLRSTPFEAGFQPLPATRVELEGVAELHARASGGLGESVTALGAHASRAEFERRAPDARWLHVATHGWYARDSMRSWLDTDAADSGTGLEFRSRGEDVVRAVSPMLLCGLAFAGANLADAGEGLLTAEELATLDLARCELAVLSACDTANGEQRRVGQGIASLQKALEMAGARSVITSLWRVPDEATKELMLEFYRRLWIDKEPKWRALSAAKRTLRDARDAEGNPKYSLRDWAAWVLSGEPE